MGSKSSSLSSPTWAFWVRKASRRFLCCSSKSNSPNFLCKASRLALKTDNQDQVRHTEVSRKVNQTSVRHSRLYTYSAAASMLVDCPSPVGVIIKGTGLLFGAIVVLNREQVCFCLHQILQIATQTLAVAIEVSEIRKTLFQHPVMPPEAVPSNMKVASKRATSIGAKVHEIQFILASASLECLFDTASDSRALPQTKGGKIQVRPVVHNHRTHREMLSEIVLTEDPRKHKLKFPSRKKRRRRRGG